MNITPDRIYEAVAQTIKGQDEYVKTLATLAWLQMLRYKNRKVNNRADGKINALVIGASGTGKTATVKATLAGVSSVKYTSSNKKVATVNSKTGAVKGLKAGTVTITATSGKLKATYKLTVKNPTFSLTKSSATIKKGKTTTIKSKAAPAGKVTYTSSNRKVATVTSKGVVKGIKKGKATITVKCNGITKKFVVTVK